MYLQLHFHSHFLAWAVSRLEELFSPGRNDLLTGLLRMLRRI
jgi:hypothetical protein